MSGTQRRTLIDERFARAWAIPVWTIWTSPGCARNEAFVPLDGGRGQLLSGSPITSRSRSSFCLRRELYDRRSLFAVPDYTEAGWTPSCVELQQQWIPRAGGCSCGWSWRRSSRTSTDCLRRPEKRRRTSASCGSRTSRCTSGTRRRKQWDAAHHPFTSPYEEDIGKSGASFAWNYDFKVRCARGLA